MSDAIQSFIARWENSGAAERANYQLFLSELCDLLGVPHPEPATPDTSQNAYVFERAVTFHHGDGSTSTGRIDLYKRGCFVLEAKQGVEYDTAAGTPPLSSVVRDHQRNRSKGIGHRGSPAWDEAIIRARGQAEQYIRALSPDEGRPPFLIVADVGHSFELYSEFSCTGGTYIPFPAPGSHRILLSDLEQEDARERLKAVWTNPLSLDPTRRSAQVTREIADRLARLAVALEKDGHDPHEVASFLMRCLFTMFAEDVGLLAKDRFTRLLESLESSPEHFVPMAEELWGRMNEGGFSTSLRCDILHFNGGLFESARAIPLSRDHLLLLIEAAKCDWRDVEPAIFGTLLERALDPTERHKLGAHYTPRAYVERLVLPTIVNPVRSEWESVRAAAMVLVNAGEVAKAVKEIESFHRKLVNIKVLDPACGSGNFLYVTLEHLKRIEGEVFDTLDSLDARQGMMEFSGVTVDPHQLLGIEVNPRAAAIAELVLWIGTLQWHFRNRGRVMPPQPIIKNFHNIECRDALIDWDSVEPEVDDSGTPVTRWDGRTTKPHPVTGKEVPDESARVPVVRYRHPRPATWPKADFVIGNPPFIGPGLMRQALGDGYTEAVRSARNAIGASSDFAMYWWDHAAGLARAGEIRRFGFVSTNSIRQTLNRRTVEMHLGAKNALSIVFAIPDHPWVDSADGAAVRIAMTCGEAGDVAGILQRVVSEVPGEGDGFDVLLESRRGKIQPDLTIGANVSAAKALLANDGLSCPGVKLHGAGFIVTPAEAVSLGLGTVPGVELHIRGYRNGKDLTASPRGVMVIDLFGLNETEARQRFPSIYQHVFDTVKPQRDARKGTSTDSDQYAKTWWLFGKTREALRQSLTALTRYVATPETAKHRFFVFLDRSILPDNMLVCIAHDDAFFLGVLSSRAHVCWALSTGGRLGVGNDPRYNKTRCFETFPFPEANEDQKHRIRELAEQLDAHRKARQAEHPKLTMTGMYNVLEKLRAGETLSDKDKTVHEQGLVSVLKQIHDDIDREVCDAYGFAPEISDEEILERLVALNAARSAEEANGLIRWLRPDFQKQSGKISQAEIDVSGSTKAIKAKKESSKTLPWPKTLPEQVSAVREVLADSGIPMTAESIARRFVRARTAKVIPILETLVALGQARMTGPDLFVKGS